MLYRSPNEGCAILRNSIASYLLRYRGLFAQPEQIIIGSGAEHLYGTVVRILGADKIYGIEDPSYHQIRKVYEGTGAVCEMLPMGEDGIRSDVLAQTRADVLHVTPFHSFPSGVTATIGKRYEYLEWAREKHHFIVEDDFDSEFFMPGKPVEQIRDLFDGYQFSDDREEKNDVFGSYWVFRIAAYGFLAIISLITMLNIMNSISMSVSARVKQYGAMRAVGMESRQVTKMITAEAVTYAVYGTIAGTALGLILHYLIYVKIVISHFGGFWNIPFTTIGIVLLLVVFSCIIAVHEPTKRMRDMAITDTINDL